MNSIRPSIIRATSPAMSKSFSTTAHLLEENQPFPRGGFEDPLPPSDIEAKFRANAKLALPVDRIERILDAVQHLEKLALTRELSDLLLKA